VPRSVYLIDFYFIYLILKIYFTIETREGFSFSFREEIKKGIKYPIVHPFSVQTDKKYPCGAL